jgi:hypothetical protein
MPGCGDSRAIQRLALGDRAGIWLLATAFVLRTIGDFRYVGLFKRERLTLFAELDGRIYTSLCGALAAGVIYLALHLTGAGAN